MKFLFLTPALHVGGVERWFLTLARHARAVRPHGVLMTGGLGLHPQILAEAQGLCPVWLETDAHRARLRCWEEAQRCDAVVAWGFQKNLGALVGGLDLPVVLVSHGAKDLRQILAEIHPFATHLAAVSGVAAEAFPEALRARVRVLYNGSDLERSAPSPGARERLRTAWGVGDRTLVLYLGRISPEKRADLALASVFALGDSYAAALCGPARRDELEKVKQVAGRMGNVVLLGGGEIEPRDLLAACDVVALPSLHEGFPLTMIEAWLARRPVAVTPFGLAREMIERHGEILFCSRNEFNEHTVPRALAEAIRRAAMDDGTVVQRAFETAWEHYTATAMARRWDEYLLEAIYDHRRSRWGGPKMTEISRRASVSA